MERKIIKIEARPVLTSGVERKTKQRRVVAYARVSTSSEEQLGEQFIPPGHQLIECNQKALLDILLSKMRSFAGGIGLVLFITPPYHSERML